MCAAEQRFGSPPCPLRTPKEYCGGLRRGAGRQHFDNAPWPSPPPVPASGAGRAGSTSGGTALPDFLLSTGNNAECLHVSSSMVLLLRMSTFPLMHNDFASQFSIKGHIPLCLSRYVQPKRERCHSGSSTSSAIIGRAPT